MPLNSFEVALPTFLVGAISEEAVFHYVREADVVTAYCEEHDLRCFHLLEKIHLIGLFVGLEKAEQVGAGGPGAGDDHGVGFHIDAIGVPGAVAGVVLAVLLVVPRSFTGGVGVPQYDGSSSVMLEEDTSVPPLQVSVDQVHRPPSRHRAERLGAGEHNPVHLSRVSGTSAYGPHLLHRAARRNRSQALAGRGHEGNRLAIAEGDQKAGIRNGIPARVVDRDPEVHELTCPHRFGIRH